MEKLPSFCDCWPGSGTGRESDSWVGMSCNSSEARSPARQEASCEETSTCRLGSLPWVSPPGPRSRTGLQEHLTPHPGCASCPLWDLSPKHLGLLSPIGTVGAVLPCTWWWGKHLAHSRCLVNWMQWLSVDSGAGLEGQLQKEVDPVNSMLYNPLCSQFQEAGRSGHWAQLVAVCLLSVGCCRRQHLLLWHRWSEEPATPRERLGFSSYSCCKQTEREDAVFCWQPGCERWNRMWCLFGSFRLRVGEVAVTCLGCVFLASREICEIQAIFTALLGCVCYMFACMCVLTVNPPTCLCSQLRETNPQQWIVERLWFHYGAYVEQWVFEKRNSGESTWIRLNFFFLWVSRKWVILVILHPVVFDTCARDVIEPSSVCFFPWKLWKWYHSVPELAGISRVCRVVGSFWFLETTYQI